MESVDFIELVNNKANKEILNAAVYSRIIEKMKNEFSEEQKKWYMANMFMYLNYHPTRDFPINLDDIWKMLGFANKGNAKRTLENNFVTGEDYQCLLLPKEKQTRGGTNKETITLNTDTFKNLCMLAKTDCGKEIRKYYVKLETINNEILKEEIEENSKQLNAQREMIETLKNKPTILGFYERKPGNLYIIKDSTKPGHIKIGFSSNTLNRISQLNCGSSTASIKILTSYYTFDMEFAEKIVHGALKPFKIQQRNEWFYVENEKDMIYILKAIESCIMFIKQFDIYSIPDDVEDFELKILEEIESRNELERTHHEEQKRFINKKRGSTCEHKTGKYKGVFYRNDKNAWESTIKMDYGEYFLGYYDSEEEAAFIYNDYAIFLNETKSTTYTINYIKDYTPNPRDIVLENRKRVEENKTSKYIGVYFDSKKKVFNSGIWYNNKHHHLGKSSNEEECAMMYNRQALFFNDTKGTNYDLNVVSETEDIFPENLYEKNQTYLKNKKSSSFIGVRKQSKNRYTAHISVKHKSVHLGCFENEVDAAKAFNAYAIELNKTKSSRLYKLNDIPNDISNTT